MTGPRHMEARPDRHPSARTATREVERRSGALSTPGADSHLNTPGWQRQSSGEFKIHHGDYIAYVIRLRLPPANETYWTFSIVRLRHGDLKPFAYFFPVAHGHRKTLRGAKRAASVLLNSIPAVAAPVDHPRHPAP